VAFTTHDDIVHDTRCHCRKSKRRGNEPRGTSSVARSMGPNKNEPLLRVTNGHALGPNQSRTSTSSNVWIKTEPSHGCARHGTPLSTSRTRRRIDAKVVERPVGTFTRQTRINKKANRSAAYTSRPGRFGLEPSSDSNRGCAARQHQLDRHWSSLEPAMPLQRQAPTSEYHLERLAAEFRLRFPTSATRASLLVAP